MTVSYTHLHQVSVTPLPVDLTHYAHLALVREWLAQ